MIAAPTTRYHDALTSLRNRGKLKARYDNFIGGKFVPPVEGRYFTDTSPINGEPLCEFARSTPADIELALDAAHAARRAWARISAAERAKMLNGIADRIDENLETLALAETMDNGKPIRETRAADVPLAADHFRYFAACVRAEEGSITELDSETVAYHFREPFGVVGQIIPWNFPLLMAAWKLGPALGAGNCVVLKPASETPLSVMVLMSLIADVLPPGVLNVVNGKGAEIGKALGANPRISRVAFTGETTTGRLIMQYASETIIPMTMELGGKSPNIFMADVMDADDAFFDKALEGFTLFAFNKGEVCTCPSRALIQASIFDKFMERAVARVGKITVGDPLDPATMMGAQASQEQLDKILRYIDIGKAEGARCVTGGSRAQLDGDLKNGYYVQPTVFTGNNKMRIFQEEIFGPVLSVTTFKDVDEAIEIANDTMYGLGSGVWTRNGTIAYRVGREIEAGRVWTNCYHVYPAGAAFGGYKKSGFGRETHKMEMESYQQTKNLLVSYNPNAMGFF
jgi:aldehyde dehydrogenase